MFLNLYKYSLLQIPSLYNNQNICLVYIYNTKSTYIYIYIYTYIHHRNKIIAFIIEPRPKPVCNYFTALCTTDNSQKCQNNLATEKQSWWFIPFVFTSSLETLYYQLMYYVQYLITLLSEIRCHGFCSNILISCYLEENCHLYADG